MHSMHAFILAILFNLFVPQQTATLTITFTNIQTAKGQLMIALNDTKGSMVNGYIVPVTKAGNVTYTIKDVKPGAYTLAVFHDINKDETLNTNLVGVPKEPYGFSNNARGTFGPPSLAEQTFTVTDKTSLSIALK